ncbi:MAG: RNA polymerase sigma factor [Hyphomonadaceae bacterium]
MRRSEDMTHARERLFDEYLAASARAGSRIALGQLAERFQPRLLGHAGRLTGDVEAARDVVQEAWIEIVRGLPRLDDATAFPAWAFRIVSRRCARWIRKVQQRRRIDTAYAAEPIETTTTNGGERASDASRIARVMANLSPDHRAAIALFYLEDLSVAEIAVALDVPPGTVKTRLMHARDKLRRSLNLKEPHNE